MKLISSDGSRTRFYTRPPVGTVNPPLGPTMGNRPGPRFDPSQYPIPPAQNVPPFIPVNMGDNTRTMVPNPEYGRLHGLEWDGSKWVKANPNSDLERQAAEMALEQARWRMQQEKEKAEREKEKAEREKLEWNEQYRRDFAERLRESAVPMPPEQTPEQIRAAQLRQVAIEQAQQAQRQKNLDQMRWRQRENMAGRMGPPGGRTDGRSVRPVGPVDDSGRRTDSQMLMEILEELQAQYPYVPIERLREAAQSILEERVRSQTQDFERQYKLPPRPQPYTPKQTPPIMPAPAGQPRAFNPSGPTRQLFKPGQAQPVEPPAQGTQYGEMIGKTGAATTQFIDADNDGVDDRYQRGPGQPRVDPRKPTAGWRYPPQPGDKPLAPPRPGMTY